MIPIRVERAIERPFSEEEHEEEEGDVDPIMSTRGHLPEGETHRGGQEGTVSRSVGTVSRLAPNLAGEPAPCAERL